MKKTVLVFSLVLANSANAQVVSVECPQAYPSKASPLEVLPGEKGRGLVSPGNPLVDWSLYDGEFGEATQIHAGAERRVAGGMDTVVPPVRWLVCNFRGGLSWWAETGADKAAEKKLIREGCRVLSRTAPTTVRLICN